MTENINTAELIKLISRGAIWAVGDGGDILTFDVLPLSLFVGGKEFGHCLLA
jgi:hypothetical protein